MGKTTRYQKHEIDRKDTRKSKQTVPLLGQRNPSPIEKDGYYNE
jgi:hypothetical protein